MAERALGRLKKASYMRRRISTLHERKQTMKKIRFFNAKMCLTALCMTGKKVNYGKTDHKENQAL